MNKIISILLIMFLFQGCSLIFNGPSFTSTEVRDKMFPKNKLPLKESVTIYWNENRIPFIEAGNDYDLAFAIGLVHAHLRLGQMEFFKRVAQGRLSETGGPFATDIDKTIRIFNFGKAVPDIIKLLPPESKEWVGRYIDGINHYINRMPKLSADMEALGIEPEQWNMKDLITMWRLLSADVNWFNFLGALQLRGKPGAEKLWNDLLEYGKTSSPGFSYTDLKDHPEALSYLFSKSGSNSIVVSSAKTGDSSAIIANDPHLGIMIPNTWLLIGYKSPNYHAIGMTLPGLPVIALGRNPEISWGGTNMRTLSTTLYKLSPDDMANVTTEKDEIKVCLWFDETMERRFSDWGPILSDSPFFELPFPVAVKWMGHYPSDEITAFLAMNRAENFDEFRNAFKTYGVSAQNFLYADTKGNIGQVLAYRRPEPKGGMERKLFYDTSKDWIGYTGSNDLPYSFNPGKGFIASANNLPADSLRDYGWFHSPNDRIDRLTELLSVEDIITMEYLKRIQEDVYSKSSHKLARLFVKNTPPGFEEKLNDQEKEIYDLIRKWDGHYKEDKRNAVAFDLVYLKIADECFKEMYPDEDVRASASRGSYSRSQVYDYLKEIHPGSLASRLKKALASGAEPFQEFRNWGEMHRMVIGHFLSNAPVIGGKWEFLEYGADGGNETIQKTAYQPSTEENKVFYGANARHISDMSDPDENYFVLLGGQDGWMFSPQTIDQVKLWRKGEYIKFPLKLETVKKEFKKVMRLLPEE